MVEALRAGGAVTLTIRAIFHRCLMVGAARDG
jgi:hypothetical protein